jgi:glucan biosynthesis protein C
MIGVSFMSENSSAPPKLSQRSGGRAERLYHLDAVRSLAMLFGIFVHANLLYENGMFPLVGLASIYFRMATFFLVSGYLVAHSAARTSNGATLARRTLALMLPFAVMLVLINPLTGYLVLVWNEGPTVSLPGFLAERWPYIKFLHLWFLPALWIYVLLVPAMRWTLGLAPVRRSVAAMARWHPDVLVLVLALTAGVGAVALRGLYPAILRPALGDILEWPLREMLRYLPFFALGVALQSSQPLFDRFHRISVPALALGAVLAIAATWLEPKLSPTGQTAVWLFAWAALTLPIVAALLRLCRRLFATASPIMAALTGSIYTVYLFHYMALYAFALLLAPMLGKGAALYFATVGLTFAATFALDRLFIARIPLLTLLFNGRPPGKRRRTDTAAQS